MARHQGRPSALCDSFGTESRAQQPSNASLKLIIDHLLRGKVVVKTEEKVNAPDTVFESVSRRGSGARGRATSWRGKLHLRTQIELEALISRYHIHLKRITRQLLPGTAASHTRCSGGPVDLSCPHPCRSSGGAGRTTPSSHAESRNDLIA